MIKRYLIYILFLLATQGCVAEQTDQLLVSVADTEPKNMISLELTFKLSEPRKIYSWRGRIYPLLNYGLFVRAYDSRGKELEVEKAGVVMPKVPYKGDFILGQTIRYEHPLNLYLSDENGDSHTGCFKIEVIYDTLKMKHIGPLDRLTINSNKVDTCNN